MFKLPVFESAHPRYKKSFELSMQEYYDNKGVDKDYTFKEPFVYDNTLPTGFVFSRGFNIEHSMHPAFNKITYDARHNLLIDLTNKKSKYLRNRKFKEVIYPAYSFLFDDDTPKPYKETYSFSEYGVADSAEQIYSFYKFLEDDLENTYFVSLTPIFKEHQPADGGWRWHKWGPYIGKQKRGGWEYLYDEPNIDLVFVYRIHRFNNTHDIIGESDTYLYVKHSKSIVSVYSKDTLLESFIIDFSDRIIKTVDDRKDRKDIHKVLIDIPENIDVNNFIQWVEEVKDESWR